MRSDTFLFGAGFVIFSHEPLDIAKPRPVPAGMPFCTLMRVKAVNGGAL